MERVEKFYEYTNFNSIFFVLKKIEFKKYPMVFNQLGKYFQNPLFGFFQDHSSSNQKNSPLSKMKKPYSMETRTSQTAIKIQLNL
ncbi:hypothetical protein D0X99_08235 [Algoriphagus lacus]|uniref:Uncharacterized protein n=1 Tax=Algoriphagus lacus TaxID=2056311 RepID=A0A418PTH6_9BACT|nr:hypothetical protein D0X99_08235 [Algoriphagus lacus]